MLAPTVEQAFSASRRTGDVPRALSPPGVAAVSPLASVFAPSATNSRSIAPAATATATVGPVLEVRLPQQQQQPVVVAVAAPAQKPMIVFPPPPPVYTAAPASPSASPSRQPGARPAAQDLNSPTTSHNLPLASSTIGQWTAPVLQSVPSPKPQEPSKGAPPVHDDPEGLHKRAVVHRINAAASPTRQGPPSFAGVAHAVRVAVPLRPAAAPIAVPAAAVPASVGSVVVAPPPPTMVPVAAQPVAAPLSSQQFSSFVPAPFPQAKQPVDPAAASRFVPTVDLGSSPGGSKAQTPRRAPQPTLPASPNQPMCVKRSEAQTTRKFSAAENTRSVAVRGQLPAEYAAPVPLLAYSYATSAIPHASEDPYGQQQQQRSVPSPARQRATLLSITQAPAVLATFVATIYPAKARFRRPSFYPVTEVRISNVDLASTSVLKLVDLVHRALNFVAEQPGFVVVKNKDNLPGVVLQRPHEEGPCGAILRPSDRLENIFSVATLETWRTTNATLLVVSWHEEPPNIFDSTSSSGALLLPSSSVADGRGDRQLSRDNASEVDTPNRIAHIAATSQQQQQKNSYQQQQQQNSYQQQQQVIYWRQEPTAAAVAAVRSAPISIVRDSDASAAAYGTPNRASGTLFRPLVGAASPLRTELPLPDHVVPVTSRTLTAGTPSRSGSGFLSEPQLHQQPHYFVTPVAREDLPTAQAPPAASLALSTNGNVLSGAASVTGGGGQPRREVPFSVHQGYSSEDQDLRQPTHAAATGGGSPSGLLALALSPVNYGSRGTSATNVVTASTPGGGMYQYAPSVAAFASSSSSTQQRQLAQQTYPTEIPRQFRNQQDVLLPAAAAAAPYVTSPDPVLSGFAAVPLGEPQRPFSAAYVGLAAGRAPAAAAPLPSAFAYETQHQSPLVISLNASPPARRISPQQQRSQSPPAAAGAGRGVAAPSDGAGVASIEIDGVNFVPTSPRSQQLVNEIAAIRAALQAA